MTAKEALENQGTRGDTTNRIVFMYNGAPKIMTIDAIKQSLTELEELKKRDTKILELLVELLNKQMLGQEGLVLINRIKNLLSWSDKDE